MSLHFSFVQITESRGNLQREFSEREVPESKRRGIVGLRKKQRAEVFALRSLFFIFWCSSAGSIPGPEAE